MVKKAQRKKKPKGSHGHGFKRTSDEWQNSFADHIGKFVDRLTATDLMNMAIFGAGSYVTWRALETGEAISEATPAWIKIFSVTSPILYQVLAPAEVAANMTTLDKVIVSLIGGYGMVKLVPVTVQAAEKALLSIG